MPHSRRGPRPESHYRIRRTRGVEYFTSRMVFRDSDVVVRRYPSGVSAGPNFVLVHGIGVSSRYFQPLAAELSRVGQVYLVDLPGYGSAPNPLGDVSITDHAAILGDFLSEFGFESPVLVGHSMGAQVVSRLAHDEPARTDRVVLIGPTMYPGYRTVGAAIAKLASDIWREPWRLKFIGLADYLFRCGIPYFLRQLPHLLEDRIEQRIPATAAAVLVIRGSDDVIVPRDWARDLAGLAPDGEFRELPGPHAVMFTDPAPVAAVIAAHSRRRDRLS